MEWFAGALVLTACLAWDAFRRWVDYRKGLAIEATRMDALEAGHAATAAGFAEHVAVTKKAIANLVLEVKTELAPVKTDLSAYKSHIAAQQQRGRRIGGIV